MRTTFPGNTPRVGENWLLKRTRRDQAAGTGHASRYALAEQLPADDKAIYFRSEKYISETNVLTRKHMQA
jgi:hypothetical protein